VGRGVVGKAIKRETEVGEGQQKKKNRHAVEKRPDWKKRPPPPDHLVGEKFSLGQM